jgi:hypothetical protein
MNIIEIVNEFDVFDDVGSGLKSHNHYQKIKLD